MTSRTADHWHILGAGAIGGLFACRLQTGGAAVTLLSRDGDEDPRTIVLSGDATGQYQFAQQSVTHREPVSHLLICTKAWALETAVKAIAHRLSPDAVVVVLCNGMGHAARILPLIGDAVLALGTTTAGCRHGTRGELIVSGTGATQLGNHVSSEIPPAWTTVWQSGVPDFNWESDIQPTLLNKAAINAAINPLTAIHRVTNGALLEPPLDAQLAQVVREIQALLGAANATEIADRLPASVKAVCQATASNHSSMRMDVELGRETEIESIVGWMLHHLALTPPATPLLKALYEKVLKAHPG